MKRLCRGLHAVDENDVNNEKNPKFLSEFFVLDSCQEEN